MHSLITHFRTDRANLLEEKHDNRWWRHDGNLKYFASAVYSLSSFVCKQQLLWLSAQQCLILNKLDYSLGKRVVLVFDPRDQINISVELNLNVCVFANEIWMNLSFDHGKQQSKYRKYSREYIFHSPPHKRYRVDPCRCTYYRANSRWFTSKDTSVLCSLFNLCTCRNVRRFIMFVFSKVYYGEQSFYFHLLR